MAFDSGNGYIIRKSLKKSLQEDRKWAIDQTGYTVADKNFKYKSRIITVIVKDQEGNKRQLKQKAVVYWSKHFYNREIIDKYHGLSRIENQFEELKESLETRPVYVKTKERIHAHLLLCVIALTMIRLIQRKYLLKNPPVSSDTDLKMILDSYNLCDF